jgi:4-amino-4-deoxy-L-arabinose transferase-like glycosyltransferase
MKSKKRPQADSPKKKDKQQSILISPQVDELLRKRWFELAFVGFLFLIALLVRLSYLKYYHAPLAGDAAIFGKIAWGIKNGHGLHWWSMVWPPLYPFMIFLFSFVVGSLESAAFAVSLVLGSLAVLPFFFLAKKAFDYRVAYLGSVLVVFFPTVIVTSTVPLSEATYTFFLLTTLAAGWSLMMRRTYLSAISFGLLSGICYLTRPEFLVCFGLLLLVFLIFQIKRKSFKIPSVLPLLAICLAGFLVLALPYVNFMHSQSGHWILSGKTAHNVLKQKAYAKGMNYLEQRKAFAEVLDGLTEEGQVKGKVLLGEESMLSYLISPGFLGSYLRNFWMGLKKMSLFFLIFLFLALFYIFSPRLDKERWQKRVYLLCAFSPMLTMPIFFVPAGRLTEPYAPLLILLSVGGILNIRKSLAALVKHTGKTSSFTLSSFATLLAVVLLLLFSLTKTTQMAEDHQGTFRNLKFESQELKKLGSLADRVLPQDAEVIFLSGDSFFFYCNRPTFPIPYAPFERIVQFAKKEGADHLVASSGKEASWREDLSFLFEPLKDPSKVPGDRGLKLVETYLAPSGLGAVIYKFVY